MNRLLSEISNNKGFLLYEFTLKTKKEQQDDIEKAAFTDEQEIIYRLRCKKKTAKQIFFILRDEMDFPMSISEIKKVSAEISQKLIKI
jgi:hypothetical protein